MDVTIHGVNPTSTIDLLKERANRLRSGSMLSDVATRLGASPSQVALAWVLRRSPVMLPIPGTGKVRHLEENVAAAGLTLSDEDFAALDRVGQEEWAKQQTPQD